MDAPSWDRIREALHCIPADLPRAEWVKVAMALKATTGEAGFELFDTWSQKAEVYRSSDARATWRSVKPEGGVGIGSLVRLARRHGFTGSLRDTQAQPAARQARRGAPSSQAAPLASHEAAAARAAKLWSEAHEGQPCGYLDRKQVKAYGVRVDAAGRLLVPLRDETGKLWNVQRLDADKRAGRPDKMLLPGSRKTGLWHWCGDPQGADVLLMAEGYATAAALHEATGYPTAMAIDAGNLPKVAHQLRQAFPAVAIVLCADDDRATAARTGTNVGRDKATAAADEVGGVVALPHPLPPDGTDFNDLASHAGPDAVRACIEQALEALQARPVPQRPPHVTPPDADPVTEDTTSPPRNVTEPPTTLNEDPVTGTDPYTLDDTGVWCQEHDKDGRPRLPLWICPPLRVTARTIDNETASWGRLLEFNDPRGVPLRWVMPDRLLAGDGTDWKGALLDRGLTVLAGNRERFHLARYIQTRRPGVIVHCTSRLGWHGASYVFPDVTLGDEGSPILYQSEGRTLSTLSERGRLDQWKREVAARCAGNSRLVFAACCAFAGPLLGMSGMESGGFHLRGESSSGKTTALRVAASIFGPPGYMQRWRATDNALEVIAAQYCDQLLILDELGQVDPRQAGEISYMLANEQSKARSTRSGQARQRLTWRLLFLSAGEISLAQHMADGGKRSKAGQETRLADIPADSGCNLGIFEELHGHPNGADLSRVLCKRAEELHGVVGRRWIEWLVKEHDTTKQRLRELARQILTQWLPGNAGGQVHRVGGRFAIVAAAGELATEQGLTGWRSQEATEAAKRCFDAWLIDRGGAGNIEQRQMVEQVRGFIAKHGESRFTDLEANEPPPVRDRVGFKERVKDPMSEERIGTTYYFLVDPFRNEVAVGHDHLAVLKALKQSGFLKPTAGRAYDFSKRITNLGKLNLYRISGQILNAWSEGDDGGCALETSA